MNDDLEVFLEDIRLGQRLNSSASTYFIPKLTDEEMDMVDRKDPHYLKTFKSPSPDVSEVAMKLSESDSKFCFIACQRITFTFLERNGTILTRSKLFSNEIKGENLSP